MPLIKETLAKQLEASLKQRPEAAAAASDWARAYVGYASGALSAAASLPVTAQANQGALVSAFSNALQAQAPAAAAAAITQGVILFWSTMVWSGPTAAGTTLSPGNSALAGAISAVFSDTSEKSEADKASQLADAFDAGAKLVMVQDIPLVQPAPPIIGPIS